MGYCVSIHDHWLRADDGTREGTGPMISAHCSAFTPNRQRRNYGVDFLDLLSYFQHGVPMLGDPELANHDARGVWTPDWGNAWLKLVELERKAIVAHDWYTINHLPRWRSLVEYGIRTPRAVVSWSF